MAIVIRYDRFTASAPNVAMVCFIGRMLLRNRKMLELKMLDVKYETQNGNAQQWTAVKR